MPRRFIMKRFVWIAAAALAIGGCNALEENQHKNIVGNTETKMYYKNVPDVVKKIPEAKRIFFKSEDDARTAGYTNSQEGAPDAPEAGG